MKLLRRIFFVLSSAVFTVVLLAAAHRSDGCVFGFPSPSFDTEAASAVRLIDCTSVSLDEGPYLPSALRDRLMVEVARGGEANGEILYAPDGSFTSLRIADGSSGRWVESGDSEALYPLRARSPAGACETPTRVSFRCNSGASRCELNAAPA